MTSIAQEWGFAPRKCRGRGPSIAQMAGHRGHRGCQGGPAFEREGFGPRRRGRRPRGDVRAAVLLLLAEESRNGYQLMQEIEERSGGAWRPSPGSTYPALAQLEDEGLVVATAVGTGREFALTDAGRTYVEENRETLGEPWTDATRGVPKEGPRGARPDQADRGRRDAGHGRRDAVPARGGGPASAETRRGLYRILAQEDEAE